MPELSTRCPYCYGKMQVRALRCTECRTEVTGDFAAAKLMRLSADQQEFVTQFVLASGSLKEMASLLGVSYPTVRARLDRLIEALRKDVQEAEDRRAAILDAVEEKKLSPQEAARILKQIPVTTKKGSKRRPPM